MLNAVRGEEIFLSMDNNIGALASISTLLSDANINIRAVCAYVAENKAFFRIVTSDNARSKEILKSIATLDLKEIVIVELADEIGTLGALADTIKNAGIDINYLYGTTNQPQDSAIIVFSSNNNEKALQALAK